MNWLALGPTRLPELYGFVVLVNNCEKFILCLSAVAKPLNELLQKGKKLGHRNAKQHVVQLHKGLCILILFYLWPCLVVPSSWEQELWSHTDCQMAAESPEHMYWQTMGKKQLHRVTSHCQQRSTELEPRESLEIPAKPKNPGGSKGLKFFSKWH